MDASASVADEMIKEFMSEIWYVKDILKPDKLTLIIFDTKIRSVIEITEDTQIEDIAIKGRGGTSVREIIDWGMDNDPTAMVILTDGEFDGYEPVIDYPLLWIIYDQTEWESNIGEVIYY